MLNVPQILFVRDFWSDLSYTIQLRSGARAPIQQLNDVVSLVTAYFTEHTSIQLQRRHKGTPTTAVACQQCHLSPLPCHRRNSPPSLSRGPGRLITVIYASPGAPREQDLRLLRCCVRQVLPRWNERCPHRNRMRLIGYKWDRRTMNGSQIYILSRFDVLRSDRKIHPISAA